MDFRSTMRKAAGLLVELPPETETPLSGVPEPLELDDPLETPVDEAQEFEPEVPAAKTNLGSILNGDRLDFAAIYRAAHLPEAPFGAEQMLEALDGLPADLPLETRRVTVRSLLGTLGKSLGATPDSLIADATRKRGALSSFSSYMERQTNESVTTFEREIAELEAQIETRRAGIEAAKAGLAKVTNACSAESEKLDDVLEFFSLDAYPSKQA